MNRNAYPADGQIVDSGSTDGYDWMLCRRIFGTNLEDSWDKLSWDERAEALEQLWMCVKHVHGDLTPANAMWHDGKITALMLLNTAYECEDLSVAESNFMAKQRFNDRKRALVEKETPNWEILQGYQANKLTHHVYMDMNDEDFSEEHDELVSLLALLKDRKGKFSEVMP